MAKANSGKRLLNLPEAAEYSLWAFQRGVDHGRRQARADILKALQEEQVDISIQTKLLKTLESKYDNPTVA